MRARLKGHACRILPDSDGYTNVFISDIIEHPKLMAHLHKFIDHFRGNVWTKEPLTKVGRLQE